MIEAANASLPRRLTRGVSRSASEGCRVAPCRRPADALHAKRRDGQHYGDHRLSGEGQKSHDDDPSSLFADIEWCTHMTWHSGITACQALMAAEFTLQNAETIFYLWSDLENRYVLITKRSFTASAALFRTHHRLSPQRGNISARHASGEHQPAARPAPASRSRRGISQRTRALPYEKTQA